VSAPLSSAVTWDVPRPASDAATVTGMSAAGRAASAAKRRAAGKEPTAAGRRTHSVPGRTASAVGMGAVRSTRSAASSLGTQWTAVARGKSAPKIAAALPRETRAAARAVAPVQRGRSVPANAGAALKGRPAAPTASAVIVAGKASSAQRGTNAATASLKTILTT